MRCALLLLLTAALAMSARLPVAFEPNRGQEPGQADFIVHTSGAALTLRAGRAEWISRQARVAVVFESTRRGVHGLGEDALPGVVNYLIGNQPSRWLKNIPTYSRVRYQELYPGIDVVYYVNDGRLEYDVVLARGADPGRIRLRVEGAGGLRVDDAGDLVIATAGGELRQHRPIVYQESNGERREVAGRYRLRGREVRFALGAYDRARPLVIDPVLTWASYVLPSSSATAQASAMALDSAGNIYLVGSVFTTANIDTAFVAKLNSSGATAALTLIGASGGDSHGYALALDSAGNIYLAGDTNAYNFPADTNYLNYSAGYTQDAFVMKVDNLVQNEYFGHYFGGSGGDVIYGLALDFAANVYLVGATNSVDLPFSTGAAQTKPGGGIDAFVVAFTSAGAPIYSTYLGGSGDDYGNAIAVDSSGDAFVTGLTKSSNFPVAGAPFQAKLKGVTNAFVAKIAPTTGALVYSTYLGGGGNDEGNGIAVDSGGAVYITGDTSSTDFPVLGAYQSTFGGGGSDAFVTRLAASGSTLLYSTYLGGSGADAGYAIAIDSTGNAYVTGSTTSADYPTSDSFQGSNQGTTNAIVTALNASGSGLLFSSYLGGNGAANPTYGDYGTAVAVNCTAGLVVAGATSSNNFPATRTATSATGGTVTSSYPGGATDAFVAQVAAGGGIPAITPGGVVNNASFATGPVAPGSLVSIFGTALAPFTQVFSAFPLTNTLGGATVSVDNIQAPMFYAGWGQVNIQLPFETGTGTAVMTVNDACGASAPVTFQVAQAAPYILQTGTGQAILLNQDNTVNGPNNPAKVNSVAQIFLIGIGPVSNPPATGAAASLTQLSPSTLQWSATIGGFSPPPNSFRFLGLAPGWVALDQADLTVPAGLSTGAYPVVITVGGVPSNGPTMYVTQ